MKLTRNHFKVQPARWAGHKYNLTCALGENGQRLTASPAHIDLSHRAACVGMVLLENNGLLPLESGTTVALFGIGSVDYVKGGGGSGFVYSDYVRDIYDGFLCKAPRIRVYEPVTKYYLDYAEPLLCQKRNYELFDEIELPDTLIKDAAAAADVAIITIHRFSDEGSDRKADKGDFYLTDIEQKLVNDVTAAFQHTVAVLDVGGMVDVSWIKENPKIDAALLAWQAGMEGGLAVADILCGDVNPSGKLTDTFARTFSDYPSADTFNESDDYVCYFEDIYVGYRYFETIPNAKDKVVYPFGYGLSYTEFDISAPVAMLKDGNIQVTVTVKNIGSRAGKEVVQVYFSAPQGVLGKPAVELAAFAKTRLLSPDDCEILTLSFPISFMASYDDLGKLQKSAYVLEKGEYKIYAGNSCRNLKPADYRYTVAEDFVVTAQLSQLCAPNKLEKRMLSDGSFEALPCFPVNTYIPAPFENEAEAPKNLMPLEEVEKGNITLNQFIAQLSNEELISIVSGTPSRGLANTAGMGGIKRLGVPAIMTADGPAGVRIDPKTGIATTAWPCATLLACTWNTEIMYEIGKAGATECKENAFGIWLTPALNIHRNPLCGRNFEYFSEDPLIAGRFAVAKVQGIQSMRVAASAKHFACNNKETNRFYSDSRVSERALREIYFKAFEICVKEAQPWTIMTSYNVINDRRCCESYEQLQLLLRDEWGFDGMVTTDWSVPCDQSRCVMVGNDVRMPDGYPELLRINLGRWSDKLQRGHFEACAKRILQMILRVE